LDIFFQETSGIPLPPEEIRIKECSIKEWLDKSRLKVYIKVDNFQQRPNIDVQILSIDGQEEFAATAIIGVITQEVEFIIHLRGSYQPGTYLLRSVLYYTRQLPINGEPDPELSAFSSKIIDQKDIIFTST